MNSLRVHYKNLNKKRFILATGEVRNPKEYQEGKGKALTTITSIRFYKRLTEIRVATKPALTKGNCNPPLWTPDLLAWKCPKEPNMT